MSCTMARGTTDGKAIFQNDECASSATKGTEDTVRPRRREGLGEQAFRFMDLPQERK
jgi:hypothetical protein